MRTLTTTLAAVLACATLISAPIAAAATPTDTGIVLNDDSADPTGEAEPTPDQPSPDQALPEAPATGDGAVTDDHAEVVPDPLLDLEPAVEPDAEALTANAEAPGGQISGRITYPDGTPVTSGYACAYDTTSWQGSCTSPQADGTYTFTDLPAASYRVNANAYGATTTVNTNYNGATGNWLQYTTVPITDQTGATDINIQLLAGSTLSGTVRDATTNTPIDGIRVCAFDTAINSGTCPDTANGGSYTIVVPIGTTVRVEATTWGPTTGYRAQTYPNLLTMTATPQTGIDFTLTPFTAGTITGTITDNTGTPIPGIQVCIAGRCSDSGPTGTYSIAGIEPGSHPVAAWDRGRPPQWQSEYYPGGSQLSAVPVEVIGGQTVTGVDFTLEASTAGWITGTVIQGSTGQPVGGLYVCTFGPLGGSAPVVGGLCAISEGDGRYTLYGLGEGDYDVVPISDWFYTTSAARASVLSGQSTSVADLLVERGGRAAGSVVTSDGQPVARVGVCAEGDAGLASRNSKCTSTDSSGSWRSGPLPAGEYRMWAAVGPDPYNNESDRVYFNDGQPVTVTVGEEVSGLTITVPDAGLMASAAEADSAPIAELPWTDPTVASDPRLLATAPQS